MRITDSFSLNVRGYCEYCPDFSPCSENLDITTIEDLPNRKAIHAIRCMYADYCERIRERMKEEAEAQSEESEKVQCNVRGFENERAENGTDSDNGQLDGGETGIPVVREKEDQGGIIEINTGGWRERMMSHFLRGH